MDSTTQNILRKNIRLNKIEINEETVNFKALSAFEWSELLESDFDTFSKFAGSINKSPTTKARLTIIAGKNKKIADLVKLSKEDLKSLSGHDYRDILTTCKFEDYYDKDAFRAMSKANQNLVFCHNASLVYKVTGEIPPLTRSTCYSLSHESPKFIIEHYDKIKDNMKTCSTFWINMIKKSSIFKERFLYALGTLDNKSSIRIVIRAYPEILKYLTVETLDQPYFTKKEWALFIREIFSDKKAVKRLDGWTTPEDVKFELELGLTSEVLSGKSKLSKQLSNSLKSIFATSKPESESEIINQDDNSN